MGKLIKLLINLLIEGQSQLLDFEDFMRRYTKEDADKVARKLETLEEAGMIKFQREEFGFRILVNDLEQLRDYNHIE